jgi:hypothetical protein
MTDIVEILRHGLNDDEMLAMGHRLFDDAADEIERLRKLASYLTEERRRLRVEAGYD